MICIAEQINNTDDLLFDEPNSLHIVGKPEEIQKGQDFIAAFALGSLANNAYSEHQAIVKKLLDEVGRNNIPQSSYQTLYDVIDYRHGEFYKTAIVEKAVAGLLTSNQVVHEMQLLENNLTFLTHDGLEGHLTESSIRYTEPLIFEFGEQYKFEMGEYAALELLDNIGQRVFSSYQQQYEFLAQKMSKEDVNVLLPQSELDHRITSFDIYEPVLLSNRQHQSWGNVDESGNYIPILTVLSIDHPAVSGPAAGNRPIAY